VLARSERPGIGRVVGERDEAALAREHVGLVGLDVPERAKAHRVNAEEAEVPDAREERGRPLRERAERRPGLDVGVLQVRRQAAELVHDRREEQLDRFDRVEPQARGHPAQHRINILRVAAVAREWQPECLRLVAEPADRVDLPVVREGRERLGPLERRRGVRRVAVVSEGHRRREARIGKVGEVRRELRCDAAELVHHRRPRQAHHRRRGLGLDRRGGAPERTIDRRGVAVQGERELPEARLAGLTARPERRRAGRPVPLVVDPRAVPGENPPGRLGGVLVAIARDEEMGDREAGAAGEVRIDTAGRQLVGPERAGNVGQEPGAVTLAVDRTGPVGQGDQAFARERGDRAARAPVLTNDRYQGAGIALFRHRGTLRTPRRPQQMGNRCETAPEVAVR